MENVKARLKAFWAEFKLFVTSFFFIRNFAGMIGVILFLFLMTNWWLKCYTDHGEVVSLPEFTGMSLTNAQSIADKHDFKFVVMDSSWRSDKPKGIILLQDPKPNSPVKENRTIYITTTKYTPDTVSLASFQEYEYNFTNYNRYLINKNIVGIVKERIFDSRQDNNSILHFNHEGNKVTDKELRGKGYAVSMEDTLYFTVTERTSLSVSIPNLVCMKYDPAEFLISSSNLEVGEIHLDASVTDKTNAYVWRQVPAFRARRVVPVGSQVELYLTQEIPDGCN